MTPLIGFRLVLLTFALGLGTFIQILDSSIANVAVAYIAGDLAVSTDQGTWVITSFSISNGIMLAITGWLSKRIGQVRLFIWSTLLFSLTSWLCGLAWNLSILVLFRVLQGASAGALIPLSQALIVSHYPPEKKGQALGFWAMVVIVAPILGPIIGGYLTDNYGWRWIFYINIPIGILSAYLTWMLIGNEKSATEKVPLDIIGLLLLILGVSTLQVALDKGNDLDWLNSLFIQALLLTSVLSFLYFIIWNAYSARPIVNFNFFKERNFVLGTLLVSLGFMMFFGSAVLLPLWLETAMGYNAFWAGVAVMPIGILPLFLSAPIGKAVDRFDPRWMTTFSFVCFGLTFFWFSNLIPTVSLYKLMEPRFIQGLALSFFFIPLVTIALSPIPNHELASASGVFNFIRLIAGGGIGTALYVTIWDRREIFHHARLAESVTVFNPLSTQLYDTLQTTLHLPKGTDHQVVDNLINQQASLLAVNDVFWATGWLFLLLVPLIWFCHAPTKTAHVVVGE